MIISEKLYQLRNRSGLSQEELAEKMNVSRQSISKWENGSSIPSIDKILELSRIFGVSTDFLLQDEREDFPGEVIAEADTYKAGRQIDMETAADYLYLMKVSAGRIALGVMLCILSPVTLLLLNGMCIGRRISLTEDMAAGIGLAVLFCLIAAAVVIFITSGMRLGDYEYLNEEGFRLEYGVAGVIEKEEKEYMPFFLRGLCIGIVLCIMSVVPLFLAAGFGAGDECAVYMTVVLLLLVACGVFSIVLVAVRRSAYEKLLQKGDYDSGKKGQRKKLETFSSAYWCLTTAVYLGISFWQMNWQISWVIWPVAGVLYAALYSVLGAIIDK